MGVVGLIALGNPPRPDSRSLVTDLQTRGVRVLLVTGDGEATARAVAAEVGLTGPVAPPGTLCEGLDPATIAPFAIFAGVFPQEKFFLVQALQRAGHVVGMTGDGVNDAPALRQADVGMAVANATDVARAAASLVLTRPGLGAIVAAVQNSRRIFQRMTTYVMNMSMRKLSIPLFLSLGVLLLGLFVLSPRLVILLIFANDVMGMAVSTDRRDPLTETGPVGGAPAPGNRVQFRRHRPGARGPGVLGREQRLATRTRANADARLCLAGLQ